MSSFFLSSQPTVSSQEAASPSIRLEYSSHSVVTLDTLSLVASWWPVMIEMVELLEKILNFSKKKTRLITFPDPVDPTHTTQVPASDLRLAVDTLRKGDLSDTSIPAMLTLSERMDTI